MNRFKNALPFLVALSMLALNHCSWAQEPTSWKVEKLVDPLTGVNSTRFTLNGRYLSGPKEPTSKPPMLTLVCREGRIDVGRHLYRDGMNVKTSITVDAYMQPDSQGALPVMVRKESEYARKMEFTGGNDLSSMFTEDPLIYRYYGSDNRKDKTVTSEAVPDIIVSVREMLSNDDIIVRFDIPDPSALVMPCGLLWHQK